MAGVAGPMLQDHARGRRFLLGLVIGELFDSLVIGMTAYLLGIVFEANSPQTLRVAVVMVAGIALAIADVTGRTPQAHRQVPQRLARSVRSWPLAVGGAWGFDLGVLVTTRKVASVEWFALVAVALLRPPLAPAVTVVMGFSAALAIATWSTVVSRLPRGRWLDSWRSTRCIWLRSAHLMSVSAIIVALPLVALRIG